MAKLRGNEVTASPQRDRGGPGGWLRGIRFSGFSLTMMGVIILGVVVLSPTLQTYLTQRQQIADLQAAVAKQKTAVADLTQDRARWDDPSYIRAQARERLYYVMPGEVSYLIIDDRAEPAGKQTEPTSRSIQKTQTDWVSSLFASAMTAGLSTSPAPEGKQ